MAFSSLRDPRPPPQQLLGAHWGAPWPFIQDLHTLASPFSALECEGHNQPLEPLLPLLPQLPGLEGIPGIADQPWATLQQSQPRQAQSEGNYWQVSPGEAPSQLQGSEAGSWVPCLGSRS